MATKADVIKYIRKNYQSRDLDGGALALVFNLEGGRDHQVIVDWSNEEGTYTEFIGLVCDWSPEAAVRLLEENTTILGVVKVGHWLAFKQSQLTETIDEEEIDSNLQGIAGVADNYEQKLTTGDEF